MRWLIRFVLLFDRDRSNKSEGKLKTWVDSSLYIWYIGPVFKDYERDLKYMDLIMEDFNEDDEVWSSPVTDTLKITDSEQVVRGNFLTCIRDINNTMSLLICDKIWVTFSLTICVKLLQVFLAWLFISSSIIYLLIHILFLMKVFFFHEAACICYTIHYLFICTKLL